MQYRNFHVNITVGARGSAEHFTRSIFVADIGAGTRRAAREVIRARYGARRVALGSGSVVDAPRKGCETVGAKALKAESARQNRVKKANQTAKAA